MTPLFVSSIILVYFAALITISYFTSKGADSNTFFTANRQSPWYLVAFGMIGSTLSGVTFVSVPGAVGKVGFAYFQVVLGYLVGYWIIIGVLMPIYYKLKMTPDQNSDDPNLLAGFYVQFDEIHTEYTAEIGIGPSNEEMEYARYVISERYSMGKILFGLLMMGLGIGATWYSYSIASSAPGGTQNTIYCGLVLFGLYTAFKGAAANSHDSHHREDY